MVTPLLGTPAPRPLSQTGGVALAVVRFVACASSVLLALAPLPGALDAGRGAVDSISVLVPLFLSLIDAVLGSLAAEANPLHSTASGRINEAFLLRLLSVASVIFALSMHSLFATKSTRLRTLAMALPILAIVILLYRRIILHDIDKE